MILRSKVGLGTVQFGLPYGISNKKGQTTIQEVAKILKFASSNGIEVIDSASGYGNAEEVLGQNDLMNFKIVSKFMPPSVGGKISIQLDRTLQNLNVSTLYAYLAHRPMVLLDEPEQWKEMVRAKDKGKVEKIGFSLNEPEELAQLLDVGFVPDLVQVPYNYLDRRFEKSMKDLKNMNCEIHTRSSFLQGLFFMKPEDLDDFFSEVMPLLVKLQEEKETLSGRLLNFVIKKPFVDRVIIGVENQQQLAENLENVKYSRELPSLHQQVSNNILTPSKWPKRN